MKQPKVGIVNLGGFNYFLIPGKGRKINRKRQTPLRGNKSQNKPEEMCKNIKRIITLMIICTNSRLLTGKLLIVWTQETTIGIPVTITQRRTRQYVSRCSFLCI
uniref:Uncharacterized protein n=1 Tax=Cacopsylla melanoneura TaxID=428564 RepID=A0A8D9FEN1_9HEMI